MVEGVGAGSLSEHGCVEGLKMYPPFKQDHDTVPCFRLTPVHPESALSRRSMVPFLSVVRFLMFMYISRDWRASS